MTSSIDWESLAKKLGSLKDFGETSSSEMARQAIELLLGEDAMRKAVDHYVSFQPGFELARAVLWHIHPWSAMQRCYEIYRDSKDLEHRRTAVELLRVVADRRALPWVQEFLQDPDPGIQQWGIGLVDQLSWSSLINLDQARSILDSARQHENPHVRERISFIESYLRERDAGS